MPGTLLSALFVLFTTTPVSPAKAPCAAANALVESKLYEKAATAYEAVRAQSSAEPCAAKGRALLAARWEAAKDRYEIGRRLEKAKAVDLARLHYAAALQEDPRFADAAAALARLGKFDTEDPYEEALILSRAGLDTDAMTSFKAALKSRREIPSQLQYLITDSITSWRDVKRFVMRYRWPIGEMLATVAIVIMVIIYFVVLFRGTPRVDVRELIDGTVPTKVGSNVSTMLRHHFIQLSTAHRPRLGTFAAPEQVFDALKDITAGVPLSLSWLNAVPTLMAKLSPRKTFIVTGDLVPEGEFGKGLALVLTKGARVISTAILWQKEFNPNAKIGNTTDPTGYYALAEPAAIWLLYKVAAEVGE